MLVFTLFPVPELPPHFMNDDTQFERTILTNDSTDNLSLIKACIII